MLKLWQRIKNVWDYAFSGKSAIHWASLSPEQIEFIKRKGKEYTPALLPSDIVRGPLGRCFDTCAQIAGACKYKYVEGIALNPSNPDQMILHGWVTDGIHAFDPTWKSFQGDEEIPIPTKYTGIEMDIAKVFDFMRTTEYQGVIANAWRNPELADAIVPGVPKIKKEV